MDIHIDPAIPGGDYTCEMVYMRKEDMDKMLTEREELLAALKYLSVNLGIPLSEKERPSYEVCIACYDKVEQALSRSCEVGK